MITSVGIVSLLVKNQDEALDFYVNTLGFEKRTDQQMGPNYRWVTISPRGGSTEISLAAADTPDKAALVGKQHKEYVVMVLFTDDCRRDFAELSAKGVKFNGEIRDEPWGLEVVFEDLYGNQIDLVQPRAGPR